MEPDETQLKLQINTFVWQNAPDAMPLGEAEKLAVSIFELLSAARKLYGEQIHNAGPEPALHRF